MNRFIGILLIGIVFLQSCAEQRPLTGGPIDKTPPMIDPMKYSTPNYQTNFDDDEVVLTFNEWIVLKNAYSQVLISPPMQEKPKIEVRHKSVVVKFKEELRENTTYNIQFGDAVTDYTEGNPAKNLRFVFSTGDFIDSLKFSGEIVDAETGAAKADVWVMLYDNLADSVPKTERPFYVAKTDKQGNFQFENIRKDSFKVFALDDQNANYIYDQPTEAIAYATEPIWLSDSTQQGKLRLRMFKEQEPLRISKAKLEARGYARVEFNQKLYGALKLSLISEGIDDYMYHQNTDNLELWWRADTSTASVEWLLEIADENYQDTIRIQQRGELSYPKLAFAGSKKTESKGKGSPSPKKEQPKQLKIGVDKTFNLRFQQPISSWDSSKIEFLADSSQVSGLSIQIDSSDARVLKIKVSKLGGKKNQILLLPGALTNYWGKENTDTLKQELEVLGEDDFGNILAKITNADSSKHYVLQLLTKEEKVLDEIKFSGVDSLQKTYNNLEAKQYFLQLILDEDKNGRWSNGDYSAGTQPEFIIRSQAINLRAGWDNEMEINVAEKQNKKTAAATNTKGGGEPPKRPVNQKEGKR